MKLLHSLIAEFEELVGYSIELPSEYLSALTALCSHLEAHELRSRATREARLLAHINAKFEFNSEGIARVYSMAAARGVVFNFHEKRLIQAAFDASDRVEFANATRKSATQATLHDELCGLFAPIPQEETLRRFRQEVSTPSKLRIDKGARSVGNEILLSAFSAFVFSAADEEVLHEFFDSSYDRLTYERSYWLQLRRLHPQLYSRIRTLDIVRIDQALADRCGSHEALRDSLFTHIASSYECLENHGHLAFWIEPIRLDGRDLAWEICSDAMLFAEKHDEVKLRNAYFRSKQIASETTAHIGDLDAKECRFDIANEGFTYKDTFVCPPFSGAPFGSEALLLLFQKNKRDETPIPCPACRSHEVQGNSYPSLGVRSWECGNLLCPDRSKYNRGKRYSFKALLMQEAIDEEESQIAQASVRGWSRDVQVGRTQEQAVEMLVRHYSLVGDGVVLFGIPQPESSWGRNISSLDPIEVKASGLAERFFHSAWFRRYALPSKPLAAPQSGKPPRQDRIGSFTLIQGDSAVALSEFDADYFDGAVTSPPYFNAREYSQWPNIYCHLRDMMHVAQACFRVLKPGAFYLYNIFDYFDNERSIVFSAMGDKRLILSAYTADIFRRVGFELAGSVTWDKGEIEGKRGFNAGNFSPYYQAPFNCWEHVLVFVKPGGTASAALTEKLPAVLRAQPVVKMVRGQNTHGHTAPYPPEVPSLLRALVPAGGRVLDPFGGSGTTARAMIGHAGETVCVEKMVEYCELARQMYIAETASHVNDKSPAALFGR
jgi:DNA modification methylase